MNLELPEIKSPLHLRPNILYLVNHRPSVTKKNIIPLPPPLLPKSFRLMDVKRRVKSLLKPKNLHNIEKSQRNHILENSADFLNQRQDFRRNSTNLSNKVRIRISRISRNKMESFAEKTRQRVKYADSKRTEKQICKLRNKYLFKFPIISLDSKNYLETLKSFTNISPNSINNTNLSSTINYTPTKRDNIIVTIKSKLSNTIIPE